MLRKSLKSFLILIGLLSGIAPSLGMGTRDLQNEPQADGPNLKLKRVMLSSGGVGYFEYEADVQGDQELTLAIRRDQIDDVLKSIVVFDDQGGVGTIRLPSDAPLSEVFRDLPFGPNALGSLDQVISALKGEEIAVSGPANMTGRIVSVVRETTTDESGQASQKHRVTLMTTDGLRQFMMQDADTISFTDSGLDSEVKQVLRQVAERSAQDTRTLTISSQGEDARKLTIGYVVETPLWKSSYRLVLPQKGQEEETEMQSRLQGWAILENASGQDWKEVELTILSGDPVTFRQAIYSNYYVSRPTVPIEVVSNLVPDLDEGEISEREVVRLEERRAEADQSYPMAAPIQEAAEKQRARPSFGGGGGGGLNEIMVTSRKQESAVLEDEAQLLFRIRELVSVEDGQSLVVPIIDRNVTAEKVAWMPVDFDEPYPLAAVRLTNESESTLPPGVLTVYEVSAVEGGSPSIAYLGDARLSVFPKGDERMVAYALDRKVKVYSTATRGSASFISLKIFDGTLEYESKRTKSYNVRIEPPENEDRMVIFEIDRSDGDTLTAPDAVSVSLTDDAFRAKVAVASGRSTLLEAQRSWTAKEVQSLSSATISSLSFYAENAALDPNVRSVFQRLVKFQRDVREAKQVIKGIQSRRKAIFKEQERIRENMKSLPENSTILQRYLRTLSTQEDELESLEKQEKDAQVNRDAAMAAMDSFIRTIEL